MATAETVVEKQAQTQGQEIVRAIAQEHGHPKIGESLINEAEHADGDTYWFQYFGWPIDAEAVKADYILYEEFELENGKE